jgi:hypothetical protein
MLVQPLRHFSLPKLGNELHFSAELTFFFTRPE